MEKRVVLEHTTGRFAHLWRIVGIVNQAEEQALPSQVEHIDLIDHFGTCVLALVQKNYVLYREHI